MNIDEICSYRQDCYGCPNENNCLLLEKKRIKKNITNEFKPCPFCGSKNIGVKDKLIDRIMGNNTPCSATRKVWAYCRYCGCEGRKRVGDFVYDSEIIAMAMESWNDRK